MSLLENSSISLKPAVKSQAPEPVSVSEVANDSGSEVAKKPFNEHFQAEIDKHAEKATEQETVAEIPSEAVIQQPVTGVSVELDTEIEVPEADSELPVAEITSLLTGNNLPVIESDAVPVPAASTSTIEMKDAALLSTLVIKPESAAVPILVKNVSNSTVTEKTSASDVANEFVKGIDGPELPEELSAQAGPKQKPQFEGQVAPKAEFTEIIKMSRGVVAQNTVTASVSEPAIKSPLDSVTQQLQLNTPLNQKQWGNEFSQRISMLVSNGQQQVAEMRLNPARLGSIGVRIQIEDDKTNISFVTSNQTVKEAIEVSLPRLKDQLEQQGLDMGHVDVTARDSDEATGDSEFGKFNKGSETENSEQEENAEQLETSIYVAKNDGVSVFV